MTILGYTDMSAGDTSYLNSVYLYDLTAMFGAGNEPTKDWCDKNL